MTCYPCSPCSPDMTDENGAQCYPCNPCSPDQLGANGSQCFPCHPCSPDQHNDDGSQCYPCHPCSPDQRSAGGGQCYPCNPCSPDQGSSTSSSSTTDSSSGCFLTSACVKSMGLPDNCDELQTLRAFRDKRKLYDSAFKALVEEYYVIAPQIVDAINQKENAGAIYSDIYSGMVKPCVSLIKTNRDNEAISLYSKMVLNLKERYLLGV